MSLDLAEALSEQEGLEASAADSGFGALPVLNRHVLLAEPAATPLAPLVERLLLAGDPLLQPLQQRTGLSELTLADALARPGEPDYLEPQHSVN